MFFGWMEQVLVFDFMVFVCEFCEVWYVLQVGGDVLVVFQQVGGGDYFVEDCVCVEQLDVWCFFVGVGFFECVYVFDDVGCYVFVLWNCWVFVVFVYYCDVVVYVFLFLYYVVQVVLDDYCEFVVECWVVVYVVWY